MFAEEVVADIDVFGTRCGSERRRDAACSLVIAEEGEWFGNWKRDDGEEKAHP